MQTPSALQAALGPEGLASPADLVTALGTSRFEHLLMSTLKSLCGADLCSAFVMSQSDVMEYLLSSGDATVTDHAAYEVSNAYARSYWQRDAVFQDVLTSASARPASVLRRMPIHAIADRNYRDLHLRNGVIERVSLYRCFPEWMVILNVYRREEKGRFDTPDIERFNSVGDLLLALIAQHRRFPIGLADGRRHPPIRELASRFYESGAGLSRREAETCAMIVAGRSSKDIARETGLSVTSAVTYRKRAYRKIGVSDRRGLERFCDRISGLMPGWQTPK